MLNLDIMVIRTLGASIVERFLSTEEMDERLHKSDGGMDIAFERAKAWGKYAKDIITCVEKRAHLGESLSIDSTVSLLPIMHAYIVFAARYIYIDMLLLFSESEFSKGLTKLAHSVKQSIVDDVSCLHFIFLI